MRLRRATRRCLRYAQTCFVAALELPTLFSKVKSNANAAATAGREPASDSDVLRDRREHQRYQRFFLNDTGVIPQK